MTKPLPEFLRDLRPVANDAVPVVRNLRLAIDRKGSSNDLTDVLRFAPELRQQTKSARIEGIDAMDATDEDVELGRAYMPDFTAFVSKLGQATGYYDADGHYARAMPVATGAFDYDAATEELVPAWETSPPGPGADQFQFFTSTPNAHDPGGFERCPGAASQSASDGSTPFIDPPFGPAVWQEQPRASAIPPTCCSRGPRHEAVSRSSSFSPRGIAVAVFSTAAGGEEGTYEVRAIFDSGGFMVPGEEVRVAGARVGAVSEVDVTRPGDPVHADGSDEPGKAVIVLRIDDPAFQDFRTDASCRIRPQSLLGEKFVECRQTAPRAPGSEPPSPLSLVAEGERGEGQRFLPLEANGKAVDLDLVNNIMREPYADRLRLILNDLGAGLAARGDELDQIIERADPALRSTNEVLAILARQSRSLDRLALNGDRVLAPLARERAHIKGFINNAETTAAATAERRADLEAQFVRLPGFLRELRLTMTELDRFNEQGEPVIADLGAAAPALTRVNTALEPFADAGHPVR